MPLVGPENTLGEGHLLGPGVATIAGTTGTGQETAKQVIGETSATDVASVAILSVTAATVQGQTAGRASFRFSSFTVVCFECFQFNGLASSSLSVSCVQTERVEVQVCSC